MKTKQNGGAMKTVTSEYSYQSESTNIHAEIRKHFEAV